MTAVCVGTGVAVDEVGMGIKEGQKIGPVVESK